MSIYLDTSVLIPLFVREPTSTRVLTFFRRGEASLAISDLAMAEFSSAIARRVRMGEIMAARARVIFADFDAWLPRSANSIETTPSDIARATAFVRRLDLALRTPDAIHVAVAQRTGAALATFDIKLAGAATALGIATLPI